MRPGGLTAALLCAALVVGCATAPRLPARALAPPPGRPGEAGPSTAASGPATPPRLDPFATLAGWAQDNHVAAFAAFRAGCAVTRDPAMWPACAAAARPGAVIEASARLFFERFFRPQAIGADGLLTAYFTPIYEARSRPGGVFTAPVRPRPADLPAIDLNAAARVPYAERAAIEARPATDALAWMRPEDLFVLQIQGSGVLVFPGGGRAKAVFDGANGAPFRGIARPMREMGLLADEDTSGEAIRGWLADHRGASAGAIMRLDPRYVFFRLAPDDGAPPAGASGATLIAGRSVAIDPARHAFGELLWVDAEAPALAGAFPAYRRLAVALDTGGAIRGEVRADLYLGEGETAALEAGRVRHVLRLYRLVPVTAAGR